ncbi:MAG: hypothetical protein AAF658_05960, partial [Myxococcota bacterium]
MEYPAAAPSLDLLDALDALVRADDAPPGFAGKVAFGIRGPKTRWWLLTATVRLIGRFEDTLPEDADAWFVLEPEDARALLLGLPRTGVAVMAGDRDLVRRAMSRIV